MRFLYAFDCGWVATRCLSSCLDLAETMSRKPKKPIVPYVSLCQSAYHSNRHDTGAPAVTANRPFHALALNTQGAPRGMLVGFT